MIDKNFIDRIVELAEVEIVEVEGKNFSTKKLQPVLVTEAKRLCTHTLTGIKDYFSILDARSIIHVEDYHEVNLVSPLFGDHRQRETFIAARAYDIDHHFGGYLPVEDFIVYLQASFVQDETSAKILKIVGNLTQGSEQQFSDDGVTQRVTTRAGVARVEQVELPNPVTLRPFRTFPDIEQPASTFILRIKGGRDEGPACALFEADGGAWKNIAIQSIKAFFQKELPEVPVIA